MTDFQADERPSEGPTIPLSLIVAALWRRRWIVIGTAGTIFVAVVALTLAQGRRYQSTASFVPQSRSATSALSGIAAQFGVVVPPSGDAARSPAFYADLLKSRKILEDLLDSAGPHAADILAGLKVGGSTPEIRREVAIKKLRGAIETVPVQRTSVVNVAVSAKTPELARDILARLLQAMARFNANSRQTQASIERQFTQQLVAEKRAELASAEQALQAFKQRNVEFGKASTFNLEEARLQREVAMRSTVFTTLAQALEQAKIDEVRDSPVVSIIDQPNLPVAPARRGLLKKGAVALLAGLIIGVVAALALDAVKHRARSFA